MNFRSLLLPDRDGEKSATLTVFILGAVVVHLKFLFSGIDLGPLQISSLSGGEYAAAMGALGSIYVLRKSTDPKKKKVQNNTAKRNKRR